MARQVLGARASVGVSAIGERSARALHIGELAQMGGAVPGRVMEFVAGRVAARAAMGADLPIPMGPDRAPQWPAGWTGTISHAAGWAVAAATQDPLFLALDLEADEDLPAEIGDEVLSADEQAWCNAQPHAGRAGRLIFSIKECAYKAQYPRSRQVFGFDRFAVSVEGASFAAIFTQDTGEFARGRALTGRFVQSQGLILTGIAL